MNPRPFSLTRRQLSMLPAGLSLMRAAGADKSDGASQRTIADWKKWPSPECRTSACSAERTRDGWLRVRTQAGPGRSGIALQPSTAWDLESYAEVAVQVRNLESVPVRVILRLDDDETAKLTGVQRRGADFEALISPGDEPVWMIVSLSDKKPFPLAAKMVSLVAPPPEFVRRGRVNGARVTSLQVFVPDPKAAQSISIGPIVARGVPAPLRNLPPEKAFPFIDGYGQFIHRDWKNKVHQDSDLQKHLKAESVDLQAHKRPADWDRFGGWAAGPRQKASGFFRVEKIRGVWWMVDPEGSLFWSHGVVRVGTRVRVGGIYHGTPLLDREHYFRLPQKDSALGAFYGTEPQSTRGYYLGKHDHAVYDFLEANLFRKYGKDWRTAYAAQSQRRLASWGLNSIANSSDPEVYSRRQTPYTAIAYSAPMGANEFRIEASIGNWGRLPDPFDPGWKRLLERTLQTELKSALNDPWCLGIFVDNELHWGDTTYLAEATLASPSRQPAKRVLLAALQEKYRDVGALNRAWSTSHQSWDALLESTTPPDRKQPGARADLEVLSEKIVDAYFGGCRDAVKAASPNHMYLGARFAGSGNAMVMKVAARYCDIVSINRYAHSIADLALPDGLDRPIVIGEFHFGALDAAPFATALVRVANQVDRGRAYKLYVEGALRNPAVVGTHWFQYYDQPTSGRFDGENYHAGLLDICDTPYLETVNACRQMGAAMYGIRSRA
jgi:hypothetical protein